MGDRLEVRLLGPVDALRDGVPVELGGLRQRALLALLALDTGRTVTTDRLLEELFVDGSANAVQASVSRLRRALGDGDAVLTRPRGYALDVEPEQIDVARFERLRARALEADTPGETAVLLRDALSLWRGPALADLASVDAVQGEIRRLDELRLAAEMDRIDAELALGEGAQLLGVLEVLVAAHPLQERLRGQLMLALYRSGRQADALEVFRATRELLSDELGLEPGRSLHELERRILQQDPALEPATAQPAVAVCPFKGLASFDVADAEFFSGRERIVTDLVGQVAETSFVGIVGPSGIGKSSILRAGLVGALAAGALPSSRSWRSVVLRPGGDPLAELERVPDEGRIVVAIDQLEEVFTVCADETERRAFFEELERLARDSRTILAVALRADFYGRCATYPGFAALLSGNHLLIGPMQRDELERAVRVPSERAALVVEDALVAQVARDVADEPGGLPLLQSALLELWRRRRDNTLTLADYRAAGGVHGAVARIAESAYESLDSDDRELARSIMLRLAAGEADAAVRRRIAAADLVGSREDMSRVLAVLVDARLVTASDGAVEVAHEALLREWPRMRAWLQEEAQARRLRVHVAVAAHEWDERGRDTADLYRGARLSAVLDWEASHEDELEPLEREFLVASRAAADRELLEQKRRNRRLRLLVAGVGALLALAVVAGVAAFAQRMQARREATAALAGQVGARAVSEPRIDLAMLLAREAVKLHDSTLTESTLLATLLRSPAAIGTIASPITVRPQRLSVNPDGRTLAVADNTADIRIYDLATRRLRVLRGVGFGTPPVYTADGKEFLIFAGGPNRAAIEVRRAAGDATVRTLLFDRKFDSRPNNGASLALTTQGDVFAVYSLANPDGSNGAGYVDHWRLAGGPDQASARPLDLDGALDVTVAGDGRTIVVTGNRFLLQLDAHTLRPIKRYRLPYDLKRLFAADAVSPDAKTFALGSEDGGISFLDLSTGRVRPGVGGQSSAIQTVVFSRDGRTLASTSNDGTIVVWDVATATPLERLSGHGGRVLGAAFGPDGQTLYTCSLDGAIFEWDLGTKRRFGLPFASIAARQSAQLNPDAQEVQPPLAISPDGSRFAVRITGSSIGIFATATGKRVGVVATDVTSIAGIAWSSRGMLAVSGANGAVELRHGTTLVRHLDGMRSVTGEPETVTTMAFSPDGKLLAAGDVNHTPFRVTWRYGSVGVWDVATGRFLWHVRRKTGWVTGVAFSPDGRTVAAGDESSEARLYDARTGRFERALALDGGGTGGGSVSVAFSRDGTLATGTYAGVLQLWNPMSGVELGRPTLVAAAPAATIAFSPSGRMFATTGGSDGLAKLWTTATLQQFGVSFPGYQSSGGWGNAMFTPDGTKLVVVYADGTGAIWPTSLAAWEQHACAVAGRNLTREEWSRFIGGRAHQTSCVSAES